MASRNPPTIIELLKADHREVEDLFAQFEKADDDARQQALLASRIGQALTIHAEIEETLLYPAILARRDEEGVELTCEATVEHGTLRGLIAGMNGKDASQPMIKAYVKVLKEYVQHHVREEEKELFPHVGKLDIDLVAMADDALALKDQLTAAAGEPSPSGKVIRVAEVSTQQLAARH